MQHAMNVFKPPSPEAKFKCEAEITTGHPSQESRHVGMDPTLDQNNARLTSTPERYPSLSKFRLRIDPDRGSSTKRDLPFSARVRNETPEALSQTQFWCRNAVRVSQPYTKTPWRTANPCGWKTFFSIPLLPRQR
jgi:hypothetical protein